MKYRSAIFFFVFLFLWGTGSRGALAGSGSSGEYRIKAAFLYNFAKFVQWRKCPDKKKKDEARLTIGILGRDPFGASISVLDGKTVGGRTLVIRRFSKLEQVQSCHILFISRSEKQDLARILRSVGPSGTLTVGDMDGFVRAGGVVHFFMKQNKVRFEINVTAAEKARLKISSKLLKLARIVRNSEDKP